MAKSFSTPLAPSLDDSSCSVVFAEARTVRPPPRVPALLSRSLLPPFGAISSSNLAAKMLIFVVIRGRKLCGWPISTSSSSANCARGTWETPTRLKSVCTRVRQLKIPQQTNKNSGRLTWLFIIIFIMIAVCYGCIRGYYLYDGESCSCPTCRVRLGAKPWTHIMFVDVFFSETLFFFFNLRLIFCALFLML